MRSLTQKIIAIVNIIISHHDIINASEMYDKNPTLNYISNPAISPTSTIDYFQQYHILEFEREEFKFIVQRPAEESLELVSNFILEACTKTNEENNWQ